LLIPDIGLHHGSAQAGRQERAMMMKETIEKLEQSSEEAVAIESGEPAPAGHDPLGP
jgi:hypothetical protein